MEQQTEKCHPGYMYLEPYVPPDRKTQKPSRTKWERTPQSTAVAQTYGG